MQKTLFCSKTNVFYYISLGMIWYEVWRPGVHRERLIRLVDDDIKSVIIEGYHSGTAHACSEDVHPNCPENIVPFLEHARDRKVPVFLTFGYFTEDYDNTVGYQSFDEGKAGSYTTSHRMIKAGIVPLRANWQQ